MDLETFASRREPEITALADMLRPLVAVALAAPDETLRNESLTEAAVNAFRQAGGSDVDSFTADLRETLERTTPDGTDAQIERIAMWLAVAAQGATDYYHAGLDSTKTWITMLDDAVRPLHQQLHGDTRPVWDTFALDGTPTRYPGEPVGPIENWINCRCVLAIGITAAALPNTTQAPPDEDEPVDTETEPPVPETPLELDDDVAPLQWHAVMTVEGVPSGDRRGFNVGSLTWRDVPLPLEWQEVTAEHHNGALVVGRIDGIDRAGPEIRSWGVFTVSEKADEVIGYIGDGTLRGISPTIDAYEYAIDTGDGNETLAAGRICSGTIVNVPAFAEAFIRLGPPPPEWGVGGESPSESEVALAADAACACNVDETMSGETMSGELYFVSDKPWSQWTASDYTPEQWRRSCLVDTGMGDPDSKARYKLPVREPRGALNRNGVHAAAAALAGARGGVHLSSTQRASARRKLRGLYNQIGEEPPESLRAAADEPLDFRRGPGWVTNPRATRRIHDYWTHGRGAAKIGWGTPHDFYRCRRHLAKYVGARYVNRVCAQWHHDALGYWPGEHHGGHHAADAEAFTTETPCANIALVASAALSTKLPPTAWFADPHLTGPTPLHVERDGRLYGHVATWGTCHIGFDGNCVEPPHSRTNYAYFHTGVAETEDGEVPVGVITMDTGHADRFMGHQAAVAHYDNTGVQAAQVVAGEDEYGIWVAGRALPMGEGDFARFRGAAPSGDWRTIGGNLEMVGTLMVNVPGFPVPRPSLAASGGRVMSMTAVNPVIPPDDHLPTADEIATLVVQRMRDSGRRAERIRQLRREVNGPRVAALVAAVEG